MIKIGFIVEGDSDKLIIETLARQVAPRAEFKTVRIGGKAALGSAYVTATLFVEKGYDHVFVIFDTDTTSNSLIESQKAEVEESLRDHQLASNVTVCPIVPSIHAWLAPKYLEGKKRPTRLSELVEHISVERLENGNPSFAEFVNALREYTRVTVTKKKSA